MIKTILYIWQLPQNIVALISIGIFKAKYGYKLNSKKNTVNIYLTNNNIGVSLGNYIIVNNKHSKLTINHEIGHCKQSIYLGWLYLIIIGIPSAINNLINRIPFIKYDYYSFYTEAWADKLANIKRDDKGNRMVSF